jgi:hypothetical protein
MQWLRRLGTPHSGFRYVTEGGDPVRRRRQSYVHPIVLAQYRDRGLTIAPYLRRGQKARGPRATSRASGGPLIRSPEEQALTRFLAEYFPDRRRRPRDEAAA